VAFLVEESLFCVSPTCILYSLFIIIITSSIYFFI
jgi:hypothetical protein